MDAYLTDGHFFIVTQTYRGGTDMFSDESKEQIMMSDYKDINLAKVHKQALINDKYAYILDLRIKEHMSKAKEMLLPESAYLVFSNYIEDKKVIKQHIDKYYSEHLRTYVNRETTWRIGGNEQIKPDLELIFGELFVILKYAGQTRKLRLTDLEKY